MSGTCRTCAFWKGVPGEYGECRVSGPRIQFGSRYDDSFTSVWPPTGPDDWCGEYRRGQPDLFDDDTALGVSETENVRFIDGRDGRVIGAYSSPERDLSRSEAKRGSNETSPERDPSRSAAQRGSEQESPERDPSQSKARWES